MNREFRSQRYLGRRFDARENVADWDYHMKILEAVPFNSPFQLFIPLKSLLTIG
jgi:hypothetical protein